MKDFQSIIKRIICVMILFVLFVGMFSVSAQASEVEPQQYEIHTPEDLFKISDDPEGSYILMNDLDMTEYVWHPVVFSGKLDGNGHGILNLTVSGVSESSAVTYDGNRKTYDTFFSGMFGCLINAEISNLKLINIRGLIETDVPCFLGSIAGYSEHSSIVNCRISGQLELRAHDRMFGVGGIVGYGSGLIEECSSDMILICVDTDAQTKDEQFLGGAYAAGYIDLIGNEIIIHGYDSDHGYVHNGGAVGMYIQYPLTTNVIGYINDNSVTGEITFFEDNYDRRAYCEAYVGETMNWRYQLLRNTDGFKRNELFDYSVELRPEMCENPTYSAEEYQGACPDFGYTEYRCNTCGYTYRDQYTLPVHTVSHWETVKEATTEETGLQSGKCDRCGLVLQLETEKLEPTEPETQAAVSTEATVPSQPEAEEGNTNRNALSARLVVAAAVFILLLIAAALLVAEKRKM